MLCQRDSAFDAIAHPVRRSILDALRGRSAVSITEIAAEAEVSRSTASRHLAILRRSGLVSVRRQEQSALHSLRAEGFAALFEWLWPLVDELPPQSGAHAP